MPSEKIYNQVIAAGIQYSVHESDLYIPVTEETKKMVAEYEFKSNVTMFKSNIDGKMWYDIPFANLPYWEAKQKHA